MVYEKALLPLSVLNSFTHSHMRALTNQISAWLMLLSCASSIRNKTLMADIFYFIWYREEHKAWKLCWRGMLAKDLVWFTKIQFAGFFWVF